MNNERIVLWDDDGPDGETTSIVISAGGNLDWYLSIEGKDWGGQRVVSPGFRASTSGAKCDVVTTVVALLAAIGRGDREHALRLAANVTTDLENRWSRLPSGCSDFRGCQVFNPDDDEPPDQVGPFRGSDAAKAEPSSPRPARCHLCDGTRVIRRGFVSQPCQCAEVSR